MYCILAFSLYLVSARYSFLPFFPLSLPYCFLFISLLSPYSTLPVLFPFPWLLMSFLCPISLSNSYSYSTLFPSLFYLAYFPHLIPSLFLLISLFPPYFTFCRYSLALGRRVCLCSAPDLWDHSAHGGIASSVMKDGCYLHWLSCCTCWENTKICYIFRVLKTLAICLEIWRTYIFIRNVLFLSRNTI